MTVFSQFARGRRLSLHLTLNEVAIKAGVDPGNLSRWERGIMPVSLATGTLKRLAEALKIHSTREFQLFVDLAHISHGRIPPDLMQDNQILESLPYHFEAAREFETLPQAQSPSTLQRFSGSAVRV